MSRCSMYLRESALRRQRKIGNTALMLTQLAKHFKVRAVSGD